MTLFGTVAMTPNIRAGCVVAQSDSDAFDQSQAVAEVQVLSVDPFQAPNGTIQTRLTLRTVEQFKGSVPNRFVITSAGGILNGRQDFRSDSLPLELGKSYFLLVTEAADGTWSAHPQHAYRALAKRGDAAKFFRNHARGQRPELIPVSAPETGTAQGNAGVPGSVVTPTGYTETNSQPTRFTTCDGDDPIPYLIDIDPNKLPTGMNQAGAVAAVAEALNAWAASSSLKFKYEGTVSFGAAASTIAITDRRLRIQLHDNYNVINTSGVLGIGGGSYIVGSTTLTGGRVGTQGFQERLYGYVVLESTTNASFMLTTNNFKRVLTHEIGHSLGLEHSSNNASEPDAILKAATMYYTVSSGSTGATIQTYDVDRIQFGYPVTNTPPYTTDRTLQSITTSNFALLPVTLGVNRIQLRAFDRQGNTLTPSLISSTSSSGTFTLSGTTLIYTPKANYGDARLSDTQIEAGTAYDRAVYAFNDGTNLSRYATCIMTEFSNDSTPSDGLPNAWMTANFGTTAVGALGSGRNPDDDPDKDGLSNRVEWYLNTNPNSATSGPVKPTYTHSTRQISYTPVRFAPYWVESSSNLTSWTLRRVGTLYQSSGSLSSTFTGTAPTKEFYRVVTGP